jgi:collagenase-like PrtC family protease
MGIKYSVGYQLIEEGKLFKDIVEEYKDRIAEVYFPWLNLPTGRGPLAEEWGAVNWSAQEQLEYELSHIKKMGLKLNLLLNASCYGRLSLSTSLANTVISVIDYLQERIGIDSITAFSPMIAYVVKKNFPELEVRASVNMRIGTVSGMEYVSELFDGFIMQREYNRDLERIEELKEWCDKNGKKLGILANSGCMNFCAVQLFHDNMISHEAEIFSTANIMDEIPGNCWSFYRKRENWVHILRNSWIRPEDIHHYSKYFSLVKLATRVNANPERVIKAYCEERYEGNLLDLLEPSHSQLLYPYIIDNSRFPPDWFEKTSSCDKKCQDCSYCTDVFKNVLVV